MTRGNHGNIIGEINLSRTNEWPDHHYPDELPQRPGSLFKTCPCAIRRATSKPPMSWAGNIASPISGTERRTFSNPASFRPSEERKWVRWSRRFNHELRVKETCNEKA
jgi:hypothetical protein